MTSCNVTRFITIPVKFQITMFCSKTDNSIEAEYSLWNSILPYQEIAVGCISWLQTAFLIFFFLGDVDGIIIFKSLWSFSRFSMLKTTTSLIEKTSRAAISLQCKAQVDISSSKMNDKRPLVLVSGTFENFLVLEISAI